MKKSTGLFLSLALIIPSCLMAESIITPTITLQPRATYFVSDFYNKFQSNQPFGDLAQIELRNNTNQDRDVTLRIQAYTNLIGSQSDPLIDAYIDPSRKTLTVPASGTLRFNPSQEASSIIRLKSMSESQIKDRVSEKYGANILTDFAGMAPEGTYTYSVTVYDASDSSFATPLGGPTIETMTLPLEYGNINLVSPANNVILSQYPITFIWQSLNVRQGVDLHYILRIWDQNPRSSGIAPRVIIGANTALQVDSTLKNKTVFNYHPINYMPLENDRVYYWQVTAKDGLGFPIGLGEGSPIRQFQVHSASSDLTSKAIDSLGTITPASNDIASFSGASKTSILAAYTTLFSQNGLSIADWDLVQINSSTGQLLSLEKLQSYWNDGDYLIDTSPSGVSLEDVK